MPSHFCQSLLYFNVALFVTEYLFHPETAVGVWNLAAVGVLNIDIVFMDDMDVMPMPEASVYEYAGTIPKKHNVRFPR